MGGSNVAAKGQRRRLVWSAIGVCVVGVVVWLVSREFGNRGLAGEGQLERWKAFEQAQDVSRERVTLSLGADGTAVMRRDGQYAKLPYQVRGHTMTGPTPMPGAPGSCGPVMEFRLKRNRLYRTWTSGVSQVEEEWKRTR